MRTVPGWATPGAAVVEVGTKGTRRAVIARITPTGMVRLDNGAMYRTQAGHGESLLKAGEHGPWVGYNKPTHLVPASEHLRGQARQIVRSAAREVALLDRADVDAADALSRMQQAVESARARLAALRAEFAAEVGS